MKDTHVLKGKDIEHKWYVVDAEGKALGRVASKIASILRGKHKPNYAYNLDNGDYVVVVNAEKVMLTGSKLQKKRHYWHTGYPGGIKSKNYAEIMRDKPEFAIEKAVKGMLSNNPLGRKQLKKLKVYTGSEHPHKANKPEVLKIEE